MNRSIASIAALAGWVGLTLTVGWIGGAITRPEIETWYAALARPAFAPPNWLFAPVWTSLYVMMAIAAWLVWRTEPRPARRAALAVFVLQLALNVLWSFVFFGQHRIGLAAMEIVALWAAIVATILAFAHVSRIASWLMVPALAWVSFAVVLNFAYWRLNR